MHLYKTGFYGGKFLPLHLGHLSCIMRAASQCEKLYVVLMFNGEEELDLMAKASAAKAAGTAPPFPFPTWALTPHIRELALRRELAAFPNIQVVAYDCQPANQRSRAEGKHPWHHECADMVELMGRFDVAYSSEPNYTDIFRVFYPWADAVTLDPRRTAWPISGTKLRSMPLSQAYPFLPRSYQQLVNRKVLVTGTESCGKTTLVRKLATVFNTSFTQEHGRLVGEYFGLDSPGPEFYNGFLYGQKAREAEAMERANRVAICDTDALVTAFYAQRYEGLELPLAHAMAAEHDYDLVMHVEPTVPWVDDGYRSDGDDALRWRNDARIKELYAQAGIPVHVLSGSYDQIYQEAVRLIQQLLDS